jgi:heme/copper-type cytochrome/quinol oxidase subunit 4
MGIIFTFVYDSYGRTRRLLDSNDEEEIKANYKSITNAGRVFGLFAILGGVAFFVVFDKNVLNGGELFINLLLAFYAAQLSFFPHVFGVLFLKERPSAVWANTSMIAGATLAIMLGIYAVLYDPTLAWYPILVCLSISSIIYLVGYLIKKKGEQ